MERCYKETNTGKQTSDVKDLILTNKVVLLKGEAGAGKSSLVTAMQRWSRFLEVETLTINLDPGAERVHYDPEFERVSNIIKRENPKLTIERNNKPPRTGSFEVTIDDSSPLRKKPNRSPIRQQTSTAQVEDASFKDANQAKKPRETSRVNSSARSSSKNQNSRYNVGTNKKKPRDNSSRFDD